MADIDCMAPPSRQGATWLPLCCERLDWKKLLKLLLLLEMPAFDAGLQEGADPAWPAEGLSAGAEGQA